VGFVVIAFERGGAGSSAHLRDHRGHRGHRRCYILNPDARKTRIVSSIGSDLDVSTLDGLADQCQWPIGRERRPEHDLGSRFRTHRGRGHRVAGDRPAPEHRVHRPAPAALTFRLIATVPIVFRPSARLLRFADGLDPLSDCRPHSST
jgi:hypothetical protein